MLTTFLAATLASARVMVNAAAILEKVARRVNCRVRRMRLLANRHLTRVEAMGSARQLVHAPVPLGTMAHHASLSAQAVPKILAMATGIAPYVANVSALMDSGVLVALASAQEVRPCRVSVTVSATIWANARVTRTPQATLQELRAINAESGTQVPLATSTAVPPLPHPSIENVFASQASQGQTVQSSVRRTF